MWYYELEVLTSFVVFPVLGLDKLTVAKNIPPAINSGLCPPLMHSIKIITSRQFASSARNYSKLGNGAVTPLDNEFKEWFCGFADAESCFRIARTIGQTFSFIFIILLHVDDKDTLCYIKDRLGIGSVKVYGNTARFMVTRQNELEKLLDIFSEYPFNSTKLLNFLDFQKAFKLYMSFKKKTKELALEIEKIQIKMNRERTEFQFPQGYRPRVTPHWLLGFVEGEGSFHLDRSSNNRLIFGLGLSGNELALLEAIKEFFYDLLVEKETINKSSIMIQCSSTRVAHLRIKNMDFIKLVIIPFFSSLTWRSKKFLDFQDWVLVSKLKEEGHHYSDEGLRFIELILSQTNNNRLSTSKSAKVDRALLHADVNRLLSGPSNYEKIGDRIFIKSLNKFSSSPKAQPVNLVDAANGEILDTFASLTACAKLLEMTQGFVWSKYNKGESFLLKDKNKLVKVYKVSTD